MGHPSVQDGVICHVLQEKVLAKNKFIDQPSLLGQTKCLDIGEINFNLQLRTFARKFSNIDFFLKILPLKDDELVMSEM